MPTSDVISGRHSLESRLASLTALCTSQAREIKDVQAQLKAQGDKLEHVTTLLQQQQQQQQHAVPDAEDKARRALVQGAGPDQSPVLWSAAAAPVTKEHTSMTSSTVSMRERTSEVPACQATWDCDDGTVTVEGAGGTGDHVERPGSTSTHACEVIRTAAGAGADVAARLGASDARPVTVRAAVRAVDEGGGGWSGDGGETACMAEGSVGSCAAAAGTSPCSDAAAGGEPGNAGSGCRASAGGGGLPESARHATGRRGSLSRLFSINGLFAPCAPPAVAALQPETPPRQEQLSPHSQLFDGSSGQSEWRWGFHVLLEAQSAA